MPGVGKISNLIDNLRDYDVRDAGTYCESR
jgi:hypothetical protein